jgi:hypothetical protein
MLFTMALAGSTFLIEFRAHASWLVNNTNLCVIINVLRPIHGANTFIF